MIPFSPPRIDEKIIAEVVDTLKSGWITTGQKTRRFEECLTDYCGNKATVCLNSATAGLELMLRWYGVGPGDEVIVPVYTFCATANVVIHCGAKPIMVDVNEDDFLISFQAIKKAITKHTKVIMPVDFAGLPCDYDAINAIVCDPDVKKLFTPSNNNQQKLGRILILADAAHSLGAVYKDKKTGTLCDVSVFSFHAVKNLTTAEGGAIALNLPKPFNNQEVQSKIGIEVLHGQTRDASMKILNGSWHYDVVDAGYKCNMTDVLASIGIVELERYDNDNLVKREKIFDYYTKEFNKFDWTITPKYKGMSRKSSFHLYALRIRGFDENQRNLAIEMLYKRGITTNVHYQPLPLFTFYKDLGYKMDNFPVSYNTYKNEISIPSFYDITKEQQDRIIQTLNKVVQEIRELK